VPAAFSDDQLKYLRLLSEPYTSVETLLTDIARLRAQLSLPKGTEHFMSDIHGEYEAFCHIMNNCSGVIREKVQLFLGRELTGSEADELCTLIYYPNAVIRRIHRQGGDTPDWYRQNTRRLVYLAQMLSSKYTREKVRRAMDPAWAFIMDELMHFQDDEASHGAQMENRLIYHDAIIDALIRAEGCDGLLTALTDLIKRLAVDRLHVVGDIFDRGSGADRVLDILSHHPSVDIEWGNHDVLWMGAASGSEVCIAGAVRNSLAYGNLSILERGYGIPLTELVLTARRLYPGLPPDRAPLHMITVIMFKLEGQLVLRNPDFDMEDRLLLEKLDRDGRSVTIDGRRWPLKDLPFDTVDPGRPYVLTPDEEQVMDGLRHAFTHSIRLHEHTAFLYRRGFMYRAFNGNLLFHGCIPMDDDGAFLVKRFGGEGYAGRALMDYADKMARRAFYTGDRDALDFMWYLWCGSDSPVCGRRVKTFARAFIPDEEAWHEPRNAYYTFCQDEAACRAILAEFGLTDEFSHIINGHTPVRVTHGESPLKAGGRLIVIDGGFCRAYQKTTGIAGYTLIANSHGMRLMSHQPFTSLKEAQETGSDIHSQSFEFARYPERRYVRDTDHGRVLEERLQDLLLLLNAVRMGDSSLLREPPSDLPFARSGR